MSTDAQLLRDARTDPAAFRELYERYADRVYGFHVGRTRDRDAAHDLAAETFAQAWLSRRRFRDRAGGSAGPWLFGIARHVLAQSVRRGRLERRACERLGLFERLDRGPAAAEPAQEWLDDLGPALEEALAELAPGRREALELRVVEELDYDTVAASLATTPAAARVRVSRGLDDLRRHLSDSHEGAI